MGGRWKFFCLYLIYFFYLGEEEAIFEEIFCGWIVFMGFWSITNSFVEFFRIRILVKISRFFYIVHLFSRVFVSILNINFLYIALLLWCIYLFIFNCFWNKISYKEKKSFWSSTTLLLIVARSTNILHGVLPQWQNWSK